MKAGISLFTDLIKYNSIGYTLKFVFKCVFFTGLSQCFKDSVISPTYSAYLFSTCSILGHHDRDRANNTKLHVAANTCDIKALKKLVNTGCYDLDAINIHKNTPLHRAAEMCEDQKAVEILVKGGADVNAVDMFGNTPLHRAAYIANPEAIQILLANKAKTCVTDDSGNTPADILYASHNNDLHGLLINPPRIIDGSTEDLAKNAAYVDPFSDL